MPSRAEPSSLRDAPPDAPLAAALTALALPPERVDTVWLFPTRTLGERESALAVLSLFDDDPARRRILTLQVERLPAPARRQPRPRVDTLAEQGSCPRERVERVLDGVLRRLGAAAAEATPRVEAIAGDPARWAALLGAGAVLDRACGE